MKVAFAILVALLVFRPATAADYGTPAQRNACYRDAKRWCGATTRSDLGVVVRCLVSHKPRLLAQCRELLALNAL